MPPRPQPILTRCRRLGSLSCPITLDWGELFARYEVLGVRLARGLVGDDSVARDLFQEAAQATYARSTSGGIVFDGPEHARNYLLQVVRNLAIDHRHARTRAPRELRDDVPDATAVDPVDSIVRAEATAERDRVVRRAWAELPAREREALSLRYLEGATYQEMAERTGRPISTLQARVESGLARLRRQIGKARPTE